MCPVPPVSVSGLVFFLYLSVEFGAEGFSSQSFSQGGSVRGNPSPQSFDGSDQGPPPGIGFNANPGSVPSGPPSTNYNNIQIPPGAHAPANTPADLPPPAGTTH